MSALLRAEHVTCSRSLHAESAGVHDVSLVIAAGTVTTVRGPERCGKNLLLRLLGLLENPDAGAIFFHDVAVRSLDEHAQRTLRSRQFGFVFAEPFLLTTLSVVENVAMPLFKISGTGFDEVRAQTARMLEFVGLAGQPEIVDALSPLDQQKVALARALAHQPEILIVENAGESLGESDHEEFLTILLRGRESLGVTIIMSASPDASGRTGRIIEMANGQISADFAAGA